MNASITTVRLLGATQLIVFVGALLSDRLLTSAVGSGSTSAKLVSISANLTLMRISNLVALGTSAAIVVLGVLFYAVLNQQYPILSLVALALFLAEGVTLAVSKIGALGLIPLSQEFVQAGAPQSSAIQTLGDFLYHGVDRRGYDIHMLFFCLGGIVWYYLLCASGAIPRAIALWGLVAVCLLAVPVVAVLYHRESTRLMILGLPYAPFELVLGIWLMVKGFQ